MDPWMEEKNTGSTFARTVRKQFDKADFCRTL